MLVANLHDMLKILTFDFFVKWKIKIVDETYKC